MLLALNKADKLNREAALKSLRAARATLKQLGLKISPLLVSATSRDGIAEVRAGLHAWYEAGLAANEDK